MQFNDRLIHRSDAIGAAAVAVTDAAQQLSRTVHGTTSAAIPTPTAYGLLFQVKLMLRYIRSITEYLPTGLRACLTETEPSVDATTRQAQHELAIQIDLATTELAALTATLRHAIDRTAAIQAAVDHQGTHEHP